MTVDGAAPPASCSPACAGLTPKCNPSRHCVGCLGDGDCAPGSYCKVVSDTTASCVPGCAGDGNCGGGKKCCKNVCVDVTGDLANCGTCGAACAASHAAPVCQDGQCGFSGKCDPGWGDCNQDPKDGCEANLHVDPKNCTACGMACDIQGAVAACADGCYAAACEFGFDNCMNDPTGACQTSVLSDSNNCGACGNSCGNFPNATAQCQNASCILGSCNTGYADCDHQVMNGCEAIVATDPKNCGACGNACPQGEVCVGGACTCPQCNNAFPNASANCVNNQCVFSQCNLGYASCDGNTQNGCETHVAGDPKNCGACGNVCPMNLPACVNGACSNMVYKCSQVATDWCTKKGWMVAAPWQNQAGSLYCTTGVGAGNDCDTCNTYNQVVWKNGAVAACGTPNNLQAGKVYGGHSPCLCQNNLLNCGDWDMQGCTPD